MGGSRLGDGTYQRGARLGRASGEAPAAWSGAAIGAAVARLVEDGSSIALDSSAQALFLARAIKSRGGWNQLTVITSGLRIASELAGHPGVAVAVPGGLVRSGALSLAGGLGHAFFNSANVQTAFVGAAGLTLRSGLTDPTHDEAEIKRGIVAAARDVVAMVDHGAWGRTALATFCLTQRITRIVTDREAPPLLVDQLRSRGVEVQIVGMEKEDGRWRKEAGRDLSATRRSLGTSSQRRR